MKLTASDFDKLKAFYRDEEQLSFRPGKRLLGWLQDHFDVRAVNNLVKMDANTKIQVRRLLEQENPNFNVKAGLPQGADRMAMSTVMRDEKLSSVKPDDNYVLVKGLNDGVSLVSGLASIPKEISLRLPINQVRLESYNTLLVVENLDVFDALPNYTLPFYGNVLLVYRGHDKGNSKGLNKLLALAKSQCQVCWFPDLDPKGMEIAFAESSVTQILSADIDNDFSQLKPLSNLVKFQSQSKSVNYLKNSKYAVHPLVDYALKHQLVIMQQHMLTHQLPLKVYDKFLLNR